MGAACLGRASASSIAATTWAMYPDDYEDRIQSLKPWFFDEV